MSAKAKRYKIMYDRNLITEGQLQKLVVKGVITQSEYNEIIGG